MSRNEKKKASRRGIASRLWGIDAIALCFVVVSSLLVRATLGESGVVQSGMVQAWAVFVAASAAALGLGLLMRYAPARQVAMLMFGMALVVEAIVFYGSGQVGVALADAGSRPVALTSAPPAAALARLGVAALFLCYLARPRVARAFRR